MFKTLKNAWRQPELKNKLLFTLLIIILYRLGSAIPVPYFNLAMSGTDFYGSDETVKLAYLDNVIGEKLSQAAKTLSESAEYSKNYEEIEHGKISMD